MVVPIVHCYDQELALETGLATDVIYPSQAFFSFLSSDLGMCRGVLVALISDNEHYHVFPPSCGPVQTAFGSLLLIRSQSAAHPIIAFNRF